MLSGLPKEFWLVTVACIATTAISAVFLRHPACWAGGLARGGMIAGHSFLAVFGGACRSLIKAVIIALGPILLVLVWFSDIFGGF